MNICTQRYAEAVCICVHEAELEGDGKICLVASDTMDHANLRVNRRNLCNEAFRPLHIHVFAYLVVQL